MGTSVAQIDARSGHRVPDSDDYLRRLLDDYDAKAPLRKSAGCEQAGTS
jgi:hypothetical protein